MAQTMRNVTIHQIMKENSAHEDNNKVDGVELSTVGGRLRLSLRTCLVPS